jgi:UDP-galactopyranose mutase
MRILVVGAGLSGSVIARLCVDQLQDHIDQVVLIDKRDHIGGNCYDYIDTQTGIRVSQYGAHIFHTNHDQVYQFLSRFTDWVHYEHRVLAKISDNLHVPVPVNIETVNTVFGLNISSQEEMENWLKENQVHVENPKNGEEAAKAKVGERLYELLFKNYTKKQWDKYPEELDASVLARIPVRNNHDDRYFSDKYQCLPADGYTKIFENILDHPKIEVKLNTDYFELEKENAQNFDYVFFTGPIDRFFQGQNIPPLEYRSINFSIERIKKEQYQPCSVVNYPLMDTPYTRTVEYKHFPNQPKQTSFNGTIIVHEETCDNGEPYYPVPNDHNHRIYMKYQQLAQNINNISEESRRPRYIFVGRLASYKYLNMDQAVFQAMKEFENFRNEVSTL